MVGAARRAAFRFVLVIPGTRAFGTLVGLRPVRVLVALGALFATVPVGARAVGMLVALRALLAMTLRAGTVRSFHAFRAFVLIARAGAVRALFVAARAMRAGTMRALHAFRAFVLITRAGAFRAFVAARAIRAFAWLET